MVEVGRELGRQDAELVVLREDELACLGDHLRVVVNRLAEVGVDDAGERIDEQDRVRCFAGAPGRVQSKIRFRPSFPLSAAQLRLLSKSKLGTYPVKKGCKSFTNYIIHIWFFYSLYYIWCICDFFRKISSKQFISFKNNSWGYYNIFFTTSHRNY